MTLVDKQNGCPVTCYVLYFSIYDKFINNNNYRSYYREGCKAVTTKTFGIDCTNKLYLFNFFLKTHCIKRTIKSLMLHLCADHTVPPFIWEDV